MFRNTLQRFMYGRCGTDRLNRCMMYGYLALLVLFLLTGIDIFYTLSLVLVFYTLFRMLSRNFEARRRENAAFIRRITPIERRIRLCRTMLHDKEHRYFKCPNCGQRLRVPKGKGRITVTCRSCGTSFIEKS